MGETVCSRFYQDGLRRRRKRSAIAAAVGHFEATTGKRAHSGITFVIGEKVAEPLLGLALPANGAADYRDDTQLSRTRA